MEGRKIKYQKISSDKLEHNAPALANGGLAIKDPQLMNRVMGTKLLWHLVLGQKAWWKIIIIKKYLQSNHLRSLDSTIL
jgi:hypothetical protein